jgi:molybdopterin converting factor small subunit
MARVVLTDSLSKQFTKGASEFFIAASTVRKLIRALDQQYPGLGAQVEGGFLSVAIDGEIYQDAFLEELQEDSEVAFLPAIRGG